MAEGSSQEKTENATPRRLREARKKGQVPKSRDVSTVFVMIVVFAVFAMTIGYIGGELKAYFQLCFETLSQPTLTGATLKGLGKTGVYTLAKVLAPLFASGMFVAIVVGIAQVGAMFTGEPLKPKPERLNPVEGLKNMFKVVVLIELVKNIAKISVVLFIAYDTIKKSLEEVLLSSKIDLHLSASIAGGIVFEFFVKVCIIFVFLSLFDYAIQRWNFMKNMKMSKDEVKREYKQDEGDPAIKGERRRLHREMAFGDVRKAVKQSDAVVTNPIHVACAISYDKEEMGAPQLVAKGQRKFAEMIIEIAKEEGIPIIRNIPLAWSLIHLELDDEIPEALYEAVAEVLTIVFEMKHGEQGRPPGDSNPPVYI